MASSCQSISGCKYDLFLSFRGDIRNEFAGRLYRALMEKNINTFRDENNLLKGENISKILREIEESRFSIIILSKGYPGSSWCLDELQKIIERKKDKDHIFVPVFYDVKPSEVELLTGEFGIAFDKIVESSNDEQVEQWKAALKEVTASAGWVLGERDEEAFKKDIVEGILDSLIRTSPAMLVDKLKSSKPEFKGYVARDIRDLARHGENECTSIVQAGAIHELAKLLPSTPYFLAQTEAIAALQKLSKQKYGKKNIMADDKAISGIVGVLEYGQRLAREYAAGTILNLSMNIHSRQDETEVKVKIGSSGAIHALCTLLKEGTQRGKEHSAAALSELCTCRDNHKKALGAGVVRAIIPQMLKISRDTKILLEYVIEILGSLAENPEGITAIESENNAVPELVKVIEDGPIRARGNAAGILVHLCSSVDKRYLIIRHKDELMKPLEYLAKNGINDRAKTKAQKLLGWIKAKG